MPLIGGGIVFAYFRGWFDRRVWVIVCLLQALLVGSGLVAMKTGEADQEQVAQAVAERHIESHEEAAEVFLWASALVLALMVLPLGLSEGDIRNALLIFACVGSAAGALLGYRTGDAGGRLVYEHGAASVHVNAAASSSDNRVQALEEYEEDADSHE